MSDTNKIDESQRITVNEHGDWQYPSGSAEGYVEIEVPTLPNAENTIFNLRKKADLYLQAGDIEEYNRILTTISDLQKTTGVTKGWGKENDNARTA
jgi:hypothetical protein